PNYIYGLQTFTAIRLTPPCSARQPHYRPSSHWRLNSRSRPRARSSRSYLPTAFQLSRCRKLPVRISSQDRADRSGASARCPTPKTLPAARSRQCRLRSSAIAAETTCVPALLVDPTPLRKEFPSPLALSPVQI